LIPTLSSSTPAVRYSFLLNHCVNSRWCLKVKVTVSLSWNRSFPIKLLLWWY